MRAALAIAMFLASALMIAKPTIAQVRDTVTVPVIVQMEQAPDPPLEMALVRPLSFGTVIIPNQLRRRDAICEYSLTPASNALVGESPGSAGLGNIATASGCRFATLGNAGVVSISCEARRAMQFTVTVSAGRDRPAGLVLGGAGPFPAFIANPDLSQGEGFIDGQSRLCFPSGATPASPVVVRHIFIGGRITVQAGQNMPTGRNIEIGSIVVEARYN